MGWINGRVLNKKVFIFRQLSSRHPNSRRECMFIGWNEKNWFNSRRECMLFCAFLHKIPTGFGQFTLFSLINIYSLREFFDGGLIVIFL
ncbi:MAG: hypothetical protein RIR11_2332 [Bacteroidota bacterium]